LEQDYKSFSIKDTCDIVSREDCQFFQYSSVCPVFISVEVRREIKTGKVKMLNLDLDQVTTALRNVRTQSNTWVDQ
jgi:hypothetical protein